MARPKASNPGVSPAPPGEEALHSASVTWSGPTWLNLEHPGEAAIRYRADGCHCNALAVDDCLSHQELPRPDVYPSYLFFIFPYPFYDKATRISRERQWAALIGDGYLSSGSGLLLCRILDRVIGSYFPVRNVFIEKENRFKRFNLADLTPYHNDLMEHMNKIYETLDEAPGLIEVFKGSDTTPATYRANDILHVLTILATIGTVLTVLASFYRMDIPLPGSYNPGGWERSRFVRPIAMPVIMGAMRYSFHGKQFI